MASNSFFCFSTGKPFSDGQSMLATVATQTPRNSRGGSGDSSATETPAVNSHDASNAFGK
jgi:hypothetical protein